MHFAKAILLSLLTLSVPCLHAFSTVGVASMGLRVRAGNVCHSLPRARNSKPANTVSMAVDQSAAISRRNILLDGVALVGACTLAGVQQATVAENAETVLVIGGRGSTGQTVIKELQKKGCKVRSLSRFPDKAKQEVALNVEWVGGDLKKPETLTGLMKGVDRVVFCPGAHGWEDPDNNRLIYDEAVNVLIQNADKTLKRFVYLSSGGVTTAPQVGYLVDVWKYKRRGETKVRKSGIPYTILRPFQYQAARSQVGNYYGVSAIQSKETNIAVYQGDNMSFRAPITVEDLAKVLVVAMYDNKAEMKTFEVTNASPKLPDFDKWGPETWLSTLENDLLTDDKVAVKPPEDLIL